LKRWISYPERYPHSCPWSHLSEPEEGPYLDTGLIFFSAREVDGQIQPDRREGHLYISPQALREAAQLPGSPISIVDTKELADLDGALEKSIEEIEHLKLERERLEQELDEVYARLNSMTDPDTLADAVAERLADTFARKSGPKKVA
jgi:hypothetical protein